MRGRVNVSGNGLSRWKLENLLKELPYIDICTDILPGSSPMKSKMPSTLQKTIDALPIPDGMQERVDVKSNTEWIWDKYIPLQDKANNDYYNDFTQDVINNDGQSSATSETVLIDAVTGKEINKKASQVPNKLEIFIDN